MFFHDVDNLLWLIPFFIALIGFILGVTTLETSINVDLYLGIIAITDTKFFCCFNRHKKVQINELKQIILESYASHKKHNPHYSKLIFKLVDGKEVKGFDILDENKREGRNAFEILRNVFPKNIPFEGNLTY